MKKWLTVFLVLFSTCAMALVEEKLEPAQKRNLNTFFSNFSEANVQSFKKNTLSDDVLLNFGLMHNYINNFKSLKKSKDGQSAIIPAAFIDKATIKYFGIKTSKRLEEYYTVPLASGEAYTFSQISRLVNMGDNLFQAEGVIYSTSSGGTPNPHGTPEEWKKKGEDVARIGAFSAIIKAESERYILLEYILR
jgi:hypothetical protein